MKLKNRLILNRVITIIISLLCLGAGLLKDIEQLTAMGAAMLTVSIVVTARRWKSFSDPQKLKELENTYNDERIVFIARKSYSFAFWISVYAEFIGILITAFLKLDDYSKILGMVVCFQILIYAISNLYYSKKY